MAGVAVDHDPRSTCDEFSLTGKSDVEVRPWNVIHACTQARDILPLLDVQVSAGMRPFLVTPHGSGTPDLYLRAAEENAKPASLLTAWNDVRQWRRSLLEADPDQSAEIVHAHSFASGMAAVRNFRAVVYDLHGCVEELAMGAGQCEAGSWLARSFRVAEQFILARATAIITHTSAMRDSVLERGAPKENVFVVLLPEPWDETADDPLKNDSFRQTLAHRYDSIYNHAFTNRKKSLTPPTNGSLIPIEA
jgi:glycosyl transferase family 4